jgi:integrase
VFPRIHKDFTEKSSIPRRSAAGRFIFKGWKEAGKPITSFYVHDNLERLIEQAGIKKNGRKLIVHSFRFTYVTFMRRELPAETVMKLVGHTTVGMTEYYNKRLIDESLAGLPGADTAVAKLLT